jgi:hypothetical protein
MSSVARFIPYLMTPPRALRASVVANVVVTRKSQSQFPDQPDIFFDVPTSMRRKYEVRGARSRPKGS